MKKYSYLDKGFSLIELMVVIAVIGILATVAVPAYNNYIFKAAIMNSHSFAENVASEMIKYYDINGSFPEALSAYGYTEVSFPTTDVNGIAPGIPFLMNGDADGAAAGSCPGKSFMVGFAGIDGDKQMPNLFGGSSTAYGHAGYFTYYINVGANNIVTTLCLYYLFDSGTQINENIIPNCYNYGSFSGGTPAEVVTFMTDANSC